MAGETPLIQNRIAVVVVAAQVLLVVLVVATLQQEVEMVEQVRLRQFQGVQ
jgi:hypothetical protein